MKNYILILFSFLFCLNINAQDADFDSNSVGLNLGNYMFKGKSNDLPRKYIGVSILFGPRSIDTDPGVITTRFVDESPSMDNFTGTTEVLDKYSQFGLAINFHFGRYQGLSHSIFFDINFGDAYSYIFGYSIGYSIPIALGDSYLHIRPALGLMVGNQGFKLGELDNNAGYIEINGNQYFGSYLNMDLKTQSFLYGPQLDLRYFISDNFNIHGNVAYDIGSQDGVPSLYFTSPSTADETFNAEKEINTDNPYVDYNGEKLEKLPYNIGGLRFGIGVGYIWNKD